MYTTIYTAGKTETKNAIQWAQNFSVEKYCKFIHTAYMRIGKIETRFKKEINAAFKMYSDHAETPKHNE